MSTPTVERWQLEKKQEEKRARREARAKARAAGNSDGLHGGQIVKGVY